MTTPEEVIDRLLRTFIRPLLAAPQRIPKRLQDVIIMYNCYHRREAEFEFMEIDTFRRLAVDLVPELWQFVNDPAIADAYDICRGLDPFIENGAVSKVAILLVDAKKEHCWLPCRPSGGESWNVIERAVKEVPPARWNGEEIPSTRWTGIVTRDPDFDNDTLQELAFAAVKKCTGLDKPHLMLLESHLVYCLSKAKSVCRFYIMRCLKPPPASLPRFLIKELLERLEQPLITPSIQDWGTSSVQYFRLFPYREVLSEFSSRKSGIKGSAHLEALDLDFASEDVPNMENPCQQLSEFCTDKNWEQPTYSSVSCDGGFVFTATLNCPSLKISVPGEKLPEADKAKDSAAWKLLCKLRVDSLGLIQY